MEYWPVTLEIVLLLHPRLTRVTAQDATAAKTVQHASKYTVHERNAATQSPIAEISASSFMQAVVLIS